MQEAGKAGYMTHTAINTTYRQILPYKFLMAQFCGLWHKDM